MLVLKRKVGEKILIGPDIVITLVESCGYNQARIGIEAPHSLNIVRAELEDVPEEVIPESEMPRW